MPKKEADVLSVVRMLCAHVHLLAIEPQAYMDAMHHPEFPSIVIGPDKAYHSVTEYRFYSKRKN